MVGPDWLWERLGGWARRAAAAVLSSSRHAVPRHVAFILDGNRRFAEARQLRKLEGHVYGYQRLIDALEWCLELGVACVSVYAFSIDNYRRSGEEVATLMQLAQDKLEHMLQRHDVLVRHGVQVRVIGDLSLAPAAVQAAAARIMAATRHHNRAVLNLCFSYTASEEMERAMDGLAAQPAPSSSNGSGRLAPQPAAPGSSAGRQPAAPGRSASTSSGSRGSVATPASSSRRGNGDGGSMAAFEEQLYTRGCPPVDLLVRTSGETRLSDFLLWQSRHALLVFTQVLWPDFGFLDLVAAVMQYQRQYPHLQRLRQVADSQAAAAAAATAAEAAAAQPAPAATAEGEIAAAALVAAAVVAGEQSGLGPWQQQQQLLLPVKVQQQLEQQGSPCSIASPVSPSSPSSRSDASHEGAAGATETLPVAAAFDAVAQHARQRRSRASPVVRQQGGTRS